MKLNKKTSDDANDATKTESHQSGAAEANTIKSDTARSDEISTDDEKVRNAENQLAEIAASELEAQANNTIKNHVMVAMTLGLVPFPIFDLALLIGNQVKMVHSLSKYYEIPFEDNRVKSIVISLIGGSTPVLGVMALSMGAKIIPGIGTLAGSSGVALTGGALTYAVGQVFVLHFKSGGTLLNFNTKKMHRVFKKELDAGREVATEAQTDAVTGSASASPT